MIFPRRSALVALLTVTIAGAAAPLVALPVSSASAAAPAAAAAACAPAPIWVNTTTQLRRYLSDGTEVGSPVPVARAYGDIGWSADGTTLYAVDFGAVSNLRTVNPTTGAETGTTAITGASTNGTANALTAAADGMLLYARSIGTGIWKVDPATGAATVFANFPSGVTSAGDFITLDDGDILAFGTTESNPKTQGFLYRIHPDGTLTQVGTTPLGFGAARTGGDVYMATSAGELLQLDSIPAGPSTAAVPTTPVVDTSLVFQGATSVQDAGNCLPGDPIRGYDVTKTSSPSSSAAPGDTVTYKIRVRNNGTADYTADASVDDDLSDVLDDGALVLGSATASAGTVTVDGTTLTWSGPLPSGNTAAVTVTYQVQIDDPDDGNLVLANKATPTAAGGSCSTTCTTRTVVRPHPAPSSCPPASLWLNSATQLFRYTVDGTPIGSAVPLTQNYGDIAWSADGTTLYGVNAVGATKTLYTLDPRTGAELASVVITAPAGPPLSSFATGLSAAADGSLLMGGTASIVKVDPATGIATPFATLPAGWTVGGDFLTLANGDVLAVGRMFAGALFRIAPDGTVTEVGTVPFQPTGAALSGGEVYVTNSTTVSRVENVPTGASTAALHIDPVFTAPATLSGATSVQDAGSPGGCVVDSDMSYTVAKSSDAKATVDPGDTVTYTVTVTNTGALAYPDGYAGFADDLSDVLDDATLVDGSIDASAGAASITGTTLNWTGPLAATGADATVTVTYQVKVDRPDRGNQHVVNAAEATGAAGTCPTTCTTSSAVRSYEVSKSASTTGPVHPGDPVSYTITVANTGAVDYTDTDPASFTDDLAAVLDDATYNADAAASAGPVPTYAEPVLSWSGPLPVNGTVTVTYTVTVDATDTGDRTLTNAATPGAGRDGGCAGGVAPPCPATQLLVQNAPGRALTVAKTASASTAAPGQTVRYTITVKNTGQVDFTTADPATFTDHLSGVLDDATYGKDATSGAEVSGTTLSWSGPLAVGDTVTIKYSVTVKRPDTGDKLLKNSVTLPAAANSNCGTGSTNPACSTSTAVQQYDVVKKASTAKVEAGGTVTYTVTVTNTGKAAFTAADPASFEDDLTDVLDDATYNDDATNGATYNAPVLSWAGALPVAGTVTVKYSLKVKNPDRGDGKLLNVVTTPTASGGVSVANCAPNSNNPDCATRTAVEAASNDPRPAPDPGPESGDTAGTGNNTAVQLLASGLLLTAGALLVLLGWRRRQT